MANVKEFLAGMSHDEVRQIGSVWELYYTMQNSFEDECCSLQEAEEALRERLEEAQRKAPLRTQEEGMTAKQVCEWFDLDQGSALEKDVINTWDQHEEYEPGLESSLVQIGCRPRQA